MLLIILKNKNKTAERRREKVFFPFGEKGTVLVSPDVPAVVWPIAQHAWYARTHYVLKYLLLLLICVIYRTYPWKELVNTKVIAIDKSGNSCSWLLPMVATYGYYLWLLPIVTTYGYYLAFPIDYIVRYQEELVST